MDWLPRLYYFRILRQELLAEVAIKGFKVFAVLSGDFIQTDRVGVNFVTIIVKVVKVVEIVEAVVVVLVVKLVIGFMVMIFTPMELSVVFDVHFNVPKFNL